MLIAVHGIYNMNVRWIYNGRPVLSSQHIFALGYAVQFMCVCVLRVAQPYRLGTCCAHDPGVGRILSAYMCIFEWDSIKRFAN